MTPGPSRAPFKADRAARRQLLMTRIAVERVQLAHELRQVRQSASVGRLLAAGFASTPFAPLFRAGAAVGAGAGSGPAPPWADVLLGLWRRWRRVAPVLGPVFGLVSPLFRRHRLLRRTAWVAALAAGLWAVRRGR